MGFFTIQFCYAILIGRYDRLIVGIDDTIQKLLLLLVQLTQFDLNAFLFVICSFLVVGPDFLEDGKRQFKQFTAGLHGFQYSFKPAFDLFPLNGFAVADTALCIAEVIGIVFVASLGPAGRVWLSTIITADKAT